MSARCRIVPVILAGGAGARLWPLSSPSRPKPFQNLDGNASLLQQTLMRVADPSRFAPPVIVAGAAHAELIRTVLAATGLLASAIILESQGRNTAPAISLAALMIQECGWGDVVLVLPSDHRIERPEQMQAAIDSAVPAARDGKLVMFGIPPAGPSTGFGYIQDGGPTAVKGVRRVGSFVEKPSLPHAQSMVAAGDWHWNSGMLLVGVDRCLEELSFFEPALVGGCRAALGQATLHDELVFPDPGAFGAVTAISIDCALMERTRHAALVPVDPGWNDLGSWSEIWQVSNHDLSGNVQLGNVVLRDVARSYVRSEGPLTAVIGLEDVIVVNTGDAVIVAARSHAQWIRDVAEQLAARAALEKIIPI